jgi:uracil-DNA glycosylase family 4
MSNKDGALKQIRDEVWGLQGSPLYAYRKENKYYPVLGEGSHDAAVMFVGEAPGENEAKTGRPFAGSAGRVLDDLLATVSLKREDVYVGNVVKDRPPKNRDPLPEEIALYGPFLLRQIEIIKPKVVATLGRHSLQYLLDKLGSWRVGQTIGQLHGQAIEAKAGYGDVIIFPLYHPAAALYNPSLKKTMEQDFKGLGDILK